MKTIKPERIILKYQPMDITKFKVGDMVRVVYLMEKQKDWKATWNDQMDAALGKRFKVLGVNQRDGYLLNTQGVDGMSQDFWFPDGGLQGAKEKEPMPVPMPKTKVLDLGPHDPSKFPIGSKVRIVREVLKQEGWKNQWNTGKTDSMSSCVGNGKVYEVTKANEYGIGFEKTSYGWPSGALEAAEEGVKVSLVIEKGAKKKRRVRVGPGPWDAAPCTHLRWHLMGFFREKLAFKKTKTMVKAPLPDGTVVDVEADIASVQVVCTKCGTSMTRMPSNMAKRIWLGDDVEAALSPPRCDAGRFNPGTKKYDRVDENVAVIEAALQNLLQVQLAHDEASKRDRVQLAKQAIRMIGLAGLEGACRRWRGVIQANSKRWTATGSRRIQKAGKEIYDALDRLEE